MYFSGRVVPSTVEPQRQPLGPVPMLPPADGLVANAGLPFIIGVSVTVLPSTSVLIPVATSIMTLPLVSVWILLTYFDDPPVTFSQPQSFAAAGVPPVWYTSVIEVRHALAARITSDIFTRTVWSWYTGSATAARMPMMATT